ncbi:tetratricopeptide repeat protein [Longimicrobium sp.]|uniref:tetratricopeptide repeat protein n=1 Tax=Longimicrobium sp. TaxID=2029185 RepID=UPI002E35ED26|nr:tetratricopeptide repeat protein [Longimicrobium sp.]HEX6036587.1 tetratricopeptide repeat protein [Longimicrobium sp.]
MRTPFEGAEILDEIPGTLGLVLWQRLRDVLLWTYTPIASRTDLYCESDKPAEPVPAFLRETGGHVALAHPLQAVEALCTHPDLIGTDAVIAACLQISKWATDEGYVITAVHFSEAAYFLRPSDSGLAFNAGRACRRRAAYERAETWFSRAIYLARATKDWISYADALLGWGNMEFQRANFDAARSLYLRAFRTAKKGKVRKLGAAAQHNLLLLAIELRDWVAAAPHAQLAYELYPADNERWPYLAHDVALAWMWQGYFNEALPVFVEAFRLFTAPVERLQVWANIGRTAAALGDSNKFFEAVAYVTARTHNAGEFVASSLVNLAEGARSLGLVLQARQLAQQALEVARRRGEGSTAAHAESFLAHLADRDARDVVRTAPDDVHALSAQLTDALRRYSNPPVG